MSKFTDRMERDIADFTEALTTYGPLSQELEEAGISLTPFCGAMVQLDATSLEELTTARRILRAHLGGWTDKLVSTFGNETKLYGQYHCSEHPGVYLFLKTPAQEFPVDLLPKGQGRVERVVREVGEWAVVCPSTTEAEG